jgi:penicillin-binding protein 2
MVEPPEDRRPPLTPQLALRVAVVGSVALALFAIIFFRLWFLQVLSGTHYVQAATGNRVRTVGVPAERGNILDASGHVLVDSRRALAVQISPSSLPKSGRARTRLYRKLAGVLQMPTKPASCRVAAYPRAKYKKLAKIPCLVDQALAIEPYADVTIKTDVGAAVYYYLEERQTEFPSVEVQDVYLRNYPMGTLAAQAFGTVGRINAGQYKHKGYKGIPADAVIGQSGLEAAYDKYLRGTDGKEQITVNALGEPTGSHKTKTPVAGHNLKLSLDTELQRAGQQALQQSIDSNYPADAGSFVAMDPDTGAVYAMGSLPSYDPNIFTGDNLSESVFKQLQNPAAHYPLINRVIASPFPTGSTFKPITATAALESGEWTAGQIYDDTGKFCIGVQCRRNAGGASNGPVDLTQAIKVSSDTFFYNLGAKLNPNDPTTHPNGGPLQEWARKYGIGQRTGIDLPGELSGTLPSPKWRTGRDKLETECEHATGPFKGHPKHTTCGIADGRAWSIGDDVSLAVGQGDVQVTPLQLAVVYSTLANGGTVVRPHLGLDVTDNAGTILQKIDPPPSRRIHIDPTYLDTIRQGLFEAANSAGGTSADVFSNFRPQVYGKTGTAEQNGQNDSAWYACFVPNSETSKPIVVVVHVEQGGFGAVGAAPVAREILSQWFHGKPGPYVAGSSNTL